MDKCSYRETAIKGNGVWYPANELKSEPQATLK